MYDNTECAVTIERTLTGWFAVRVGVRQGCILSPTLFNIFLEFVMDEITSFQDFHLREDLSADIRYADDTILIATIFEKLQLSTAELEKTCKKWGLRINAKKCKVISPDLLNKIQIENGVVKKVDKFTFLGSVVLETSAEVKRRIGLASSAFDRLKRNIWSKREIPNKIKLRLYSSLILPIAIYASETWTLKVEDLRKLSVFKNDCLRAMAGKTRMDRCRLTEIKRSLGIKDDIINVVKKRRLMWFGHVASSRRGELR